MRLTKKEKNILSSNHYVRCDYLLNGTSKVDALNKLGQLEDIEDELGIDLITFFRIYNSDHFYIKGKQYLWKIKHYQKHGIMVGTNKPRYLPFKDYGKTWALTKEELE